MASEHQTTIQKKACECEHECHTDRNKRSPNGNPGHKYHTQYGPSYLSEVKTDYGTFTVCHDCLNDCHAGGAVSAPETINATAKVRTYDNGTLRAPEHRVRVLADQTGLTITLGSPKGDIDIYIERRPDSYSFVITQPDSDDPSGQLHVKDDGDVRWVRERS